jgi:hypothetical protein
MRKICSDNRDHFMHPAAKNTTRRANLKRGDWAARKEKRDALREKLRSLRHGGLSDDNLPTWLERTSFEFPHRLDDAGCTIPPTSRLIVDCDFLSLDARPLTSQRKRSIDG